jgi:hypothetical protein
MDLLSVFDLTLFAQAFPGFPGGGSAADLCPNCPASAFNPITAAFSTLGYYAQAEWLFHIVNGGMGSWAALAYILAAIGLIVSIAVGMPPRMYLWFAIGPGLFWWLVDTRVAVDGVGWRVGNGGISNIGDRPQSEVWKLSEVGLINDSYIIRNDGTISNNQAPMVFSPFCDASGACVSQFFLMIDTVVSDTIQQLTSMLGVSRSRPGDSQNTNISDTDLINDDGLRMWDLTANLKWEFVYSITTARVANNDVRQYFATFMASECGKAFINTIDMSRMTAATYSKGASTMTDPVTESRVLKLNDRIGPPAPPVVTRNDGPSCGGGGLLGSIFGTNPPMLDFALTDNLNGDIVPVSSAFRSILKQGGDDSSVAKQSGLWDYYRPPPVAYGPPLPPDWASADIKTALTCREYLVTMMQLLRWEAAGITYQLLRSAPTGLRPDAYAAQMLYGWDIKDSNGRQIGASDAPRFLENLVLIHLFRNELQIAPSQIVEQRLTAGQRTIKSTQDFQRINGQAAKYGELYTWALMMPYFQGKLLYFLAIAYPFAAMMIVVPGMHSVLLMWVQFWVWVKLWDLGFAIVTVLEKSVWAMTSNGMADGQLNSLVWHVAKLNPTCFEPLPNNPAMSTTFVPTSLKVPLLTESAVSNLVDKLLFLTNNVQLDMANTYYVYIMSALYFAIPAVTGQLVLGAKSGAAGMISSAIGQISSPAGSAAGQSAAADIGAKMKMNQAVGRQEAYAGAMRASGLAKSALHASNSQTQSSIDAEGASLRSQMIGYSKEGIAVRKELKGSAAQFDGQVAGYPAALATAIAGTSAGSGGPGGSGPGGGAARGISTAAAAASVGAQIAVNWERHGNIVDLSGKSLDLSKQQIGEAQTGFNSKAEASVNGLEASRAEAHASFVGEQSAWEAANNYAQANSEFAASIGLGAGYLDAGQKPTNMQGMARAGLLGEDAAYLSKKPQTVEHFTSQQKASISQFAAAAEQAVDSQAVTSHYTRAMPDMLKDTK